MSHILQESTLAHMSVDVHDVCSSSPDVCTTVHLPRCPLMSMVSAYLAYRSCRGVAQSTSKCIMQSSTWVFPYWDAVVSAKVSALGIKPAELKKRHDNACGAKQVAARYKGVNRIVRGNSEYVQAERRGRGGAYIGCHKCVSTAVALIEQHTES